MFLIIHDSLAEFQNAKLRAVCIFQYSPSRLSFFAFKSQVKSSLQAFKSQAEKSIDRWNQYKHKDTERLRRTVTTQPVYHLFITCALIFLTFDIIMYPRGKLIWVNIDFRVNLTVWYLYSSETSWNSFSCLTVKSCAKVIWQKLRLKTSSFIKNVIQSVKLRAH